MTSLAALGVEATLADVDAALYRHFGDFLGAVGNVPMRQAFNKAAVSYEATAVLAKAVAEELVDRAQYMAVSPNIIVDVGAGTGFVAQALARTELATVYTIQVDFASALLQQAPVNQHAVALCADTYRLPLKARSVDLLLSNLCLPCRRCMRYSMNGNGC